MVATEWAWRAHVRRPGLAREAPGKAAQTLIWGLWPRPGAMVARGTPGTRGRMLKIKLRRRRDVEKADLQLLPLPHQPPHDGSRRG